MKNKKNKYILYILLLILSAGVALTIILKDDFYESIKLIASSNALAIFLMIAIMLAVFILDGITFTLFARLFKKGYPLKKGIFTSLIGTFFNGITPSSSGGQFAQVYTFSKQGLKVSSAASILLMHFITFQISMIIFALITLISGYSYFSKILPSFYGMNILTLSLVGFVINFLVIGVLYFAAYSKNLHKFITVNILNFLNKIRIIKNKEKIRVAFELQIRNFKKEAIELHRNYWLLIKVILIFLLRFALLYSLPFFILIAFRQDYSFISFYQIIAISSFVYLITSFFPLPGASGGAEGLFVIFFGAVIFKDSTVNASAVLVWRFISFYLGLILGGLTFFLYRESGKKEFVASDQKIILAIDAEEVVIQDNLPKVKLKEINNYEISEEIKNIDNIK